VADGANGGSGITGSGGDALGANGGVGDTGGPAFGGDAGNGGISDGGPGGSGGSACKGPDSCTPPAYFKGHEQSNNSVRMNNK